MKSKRLICTAAVALLSAGCEQPTPERASTDRGPVQVFFTLDEAPHAVERQVPSGEPRIEVALEQLLEGPREDERAAGITSWFSNATAGMLSSVSVSEDGRAVVDFEDFTPLIPGASSAAGSELLLAELTSTVSQFDSITRIEYRIDGSCERFWEFLQRPCQVVAASAPTRDGV